MLRTGLALAAILGRSVRIERVRAGRPRPGLAPQHLTAVRAAAALCHARVTGDEPGSGTLGFEPRAPVRGGRFRFDVAEASARGSAGAVTLVLQTVLPALALAAHDSRVTVLGGTHVPWSPTFDYLDEVWRPALARLGVHVALACRRTGWYPFGKGEVRARVDGLGGPGPLVPLALADRGALRAVSVRALTANLPSHVGERMAERARSLLAERGIEADTVIERTRAASAGAAISLVAAFEGCRAGFTALGERGRPAERVAEEAVSGLRRYLARAGALDMHLADQLVVPLALVPGRSSFTTEAVTGHLLTNAWVVERFGCARVHVEGAQGEAGAVVVEGGGERPGAAG